MNSGFVIPVLEIDRSFIGLDEQISDNVRTPVRAFIENMRQIVSLSQLPLVLCHVLMTPQMFVQKALFKYVQTHGLPSDFNHPSVAATIRNTVSPRSMRALELLKGISRTPSRLIGIWHRPQDY